MVRYPVDNPYLDEVTPHVGVMWFGRMAVRQFPDLTAFDPADTEGWKARYEEMPHRDQLVSKYSWAVPTSGPLQTLAELGPIVEIGAGTGYWAHLLRQMRVDVVAYDIRPPRGLRAIVQGRPPNRWHPGVDMWTKVEYGGAPAAGRHSDRTLLLCWPPYGGTLAVDALRHYRGSTVVYIGEDDGGCCADGSFFRLLERDFEPSDRVSLLQWDGLHDDMTVWRRRSVTNKNGGRSKRKGSPTVRRTRS